MLDLNLASRPFINRRPSRRVALLLTVLAALVIGANFWLFGSFLRTTAAARETLAGLEQQLVEQEAATQKAWNELQAIDLEDGNAQARYLNSLIHRRAFPWSRLFDDLEDVLLDDVFLKGVAPQVPESEVIARGKKRQTSTGSRSTRSSATRSGTTRSATQPRAQAKKAKIEDPEEVERIALDLQAVARDDEAMLDFVDILFRHPSFAEPKLEIEQRQERTSEVNFRVLVFYLPAAGSPKAAASPGMVAVVDDDQPWTAVVGEGEQPQGGQVAPGTPGAPLTPRVHDQALAARPTARKIEGEFGAAPGFTGTGERESGLTDQAPADPNGPRRPRLTQPGASGPIVIGGIAQPGLPQSGLPQAGLPQSGPSNSQGQVNPQVSRGRFPPTASTPPTSASSRVRGGGL
jgi:hypothetical protein